MNNVTFIGSSIFQQWTPRWQSVTVTNRAVGGTTTDYWVSHINECIAPDISHIAFYCGSNDLNSNPPPALVSQRIAQCFELLRAINSSVCIAYFAIMKSPHKVGKFHSIDAINSAVRAQLSSADLYVDINAVIDQDPKWYVDDLLHLNPRAYATMDQVFGPRMTQWITARSISNHQKV